MFLTGGYWLNILDVELTEHVQDPPVSVLSAAADKTDALAAGNVAPGGSESAIQGS
jgi:hypothetical protein